MAKPIVFSGIQPTGRKHLGNYIGAIRQYVEGQDRGDPAIFCVVDLHAISVAYDPAELRERLYDTAAILLEPVQGEGGVHVLEASFVAAARRLADETGAVLLFDEVQTGVGRTGAFFAHEDVGVRPDALMLAKGLANGLPIGCLLLFDEAPEGFAAGDHASTFGGNPVTCAAASAVCDELTDELLATVTANGALLADGLAALPGIREVRGAGLLLGAELDHPAADVVAACAKRGLLVGTAGANVLRLTPPLIVTTAEIEDALGVLEEVLA